MVNSYRDSMQWQKKGLLFQPKNHYDWMISYAQIPIAEELEENKLRLYFGTRDSHNRTSTTFIEVETANPKNVLYVHDRPVLSPGKLGCFDDSGAMPSWIVGRGPIDSMRA